MGRQRAKRCNECLRRNIKTPYGIADGADVCFFHLRKRKKICKICITGVSGAKRMRCFYNESMCLMHLRTYGKYCIKTSTTGIRMCIFPSCLSFPVKGDICSQHQKDIRGHLVNFYGTTVAQQSINIFRSLDIQMLEFGAPLLSQIKDTVPMLIVDRNPYVCKVSTRALDPFPAGHVKIAV